MIKWINKKRNQKGFTLIELIVVIAILGILAAIAIPRFANIRDASKVKADASTAGQIINAVRIYETDKGETPGLGDLGDYIDPGAPQSGGGFMLNVNDTGDPYTVTWTPDDAGNYNVEQTVTENEVFVISD